jgi:RHS repeat-associated protein
LTASSGPWGSLSWQYDGVGNRTQEVAGANTDAYALSATSNRIVSISRGASTVRQMTYDGAGNMLSDNRLGSSYAYTYNNANRLKTVSFEGNLRGTYTYNGQQQLIIRAVTNLGTANGTVHYIHDRMGNIIAETNGTATGTVREYVWLPEAEIAPTIGSRTVVDMPVAVVDGVNLTTPATWMVHVDHLHRPIRMTDAGKVAVWQATWSPWGAPYQITGSAVLDARLPGQWFQLETGLHYNWHRHYDASLGRYTQPDPLGFVDGPSVYGYAGGSPQHWVDPDGLFRITPFTPPSMTRPGPRFPSPRGPIPDPKIYIPPPRTDPTPGATPDNGYYHDVCDQKTPPGMGKCEEALWKLGRARLCVKLRKQWRSDYGPSRHDQQIPERERAEEKAEDEVRRWCQPEIAMCWP